MVRLVDVQVRRPTNFASITAPDAMPTSTSSNSDSSKSTADSSSNKDVLKAAPPPGHSLALMVVFVSIFLANLPSLEDIDRIATVETFTDRAFPNVVSVEMLAWIRIGYAALIFGTSLMVAMGEGWMQETAYLPSSKLKRVQNRIRGLRTLAPFTSVAWNLLGAAFLLCGYVALMSDRSDKARLNPWLLRAALILWEIAAPYTLLVSAVIRYAIWPRLIATKGNTVNLKRLRNILMHNMNVVMATTEIALLGGLPVQWSHVSLAPLVGCAYVVWSWNVTHIWNAPEHGPQFIYYFFDTTLGSTASLALVALLVVKMVFYSLMVAAESILEMAGGGPLAHGLFVVLVCGSVMRFRD
jgi:hypothetical protein